MSVSLVSLQDVGVRFAGIVALEAVSFDVAEGEICGLIGPNGAGKTTLFNCLTRIIRPTTGRVEVAGVDLAGVAPHDVARVGVARTFQNLALFPSLNVRDNVASGTYCGTRAGFAANVFQLPSALREERAVAKRIEGILRFLELDSHAERRVNELPFATQKRVELARALAVSGRVLLLDEPAGGLNHEEVRRLEALILKLRNEWSLTVILVEHHMNLVMRVSDRVVALNFGRKIADGPPALVRSDPALVQAYMGRG